MSCLKVGFYLNNSKQYESGRWQNVHDFFKKSNQINLDPENKITCLLVWARVYCSYTPSPSQPDVSSLWPLTGDWPPLRAAGRPALDLHSLTATGDLLQRFYIHGESPNLIWRTACQGILEGRAGLLLVPSLSQGFSRGGCIGALIGSNTCQVRLSQLKTQKGRHVDCYDC